MIVHSLPLASLIPKRKQKVEIENGVYHVPAEGSKPGKSWHHTYVPGKFKLPFRVDMTVKTTGQRTYPGIEFRWYIGNGSIHWSGDHTRRTDLITGEKTPNHQYDKDIPANAFVDISLTYGSDVMWIAVDGNICFSSYQMPYIDLLRESGVPDEFAEGFSITISNNMVTKLAIQALTITEYEEEEPVVPAEIVNAPELSPFAWYVKGLPDAIQKEVTAIDAYLLEEGGSGLKFRRSLDENGNVHYKASKGFEFGLGRFGVGGIQEEERHQEVVGMFIRWKPDRIAKLLDDIRKSSPDLADIIFSKLKGCNKATCKTNAPIAYQGKAKGTCGARILFQWLPSDFEQVRRVIAAAGKIMKESK